MSGDSSAGIIGLRLPPALLRQALSVPRPRVGGRDPDVVAKERLEYLGDSVVDFLVSDHVYRALPDAPEGVLSALRAAAVSAPSLARIAERLDAPAALGVAERRDARGYTRLLAATLEALVGAVYLDVGLDAAYAWIGPYLVAEINALLDDGYLPAKTRLQERTQHGGRGTPVYRLTRSTGKAHERTHEVTVEVDGRVLGVGHGPSRHAAEQAAAEAALAALA